MLQFWLVSQKCHLRISSCVIEGTQQNVWNAISGGYCGGAPPLPIPNREVKPAYADGTAMQCGRVGRRLFSLEVLRQKCQGTSFFLFNDDNDNDDEISEHGLHSDDVYRKKQERTTYRRMLFEQCDMCRYPSVNKFPMSIRTHHV